MAPKLGQIVETILYTSSVPKLAAWYKDIMGLKPFMELGNGKAVGFHLPNDTILLLFDRAQVTQDNVSDGGTIPKHGTETGLGQHIAFGCEGHEALREWEAHFEKMGVPIVGINNAARGGRSVYVHDWEGHVIEVMTRGIWAVY